MQLAFWRIWSFITKNVPYGVYFAEFTNHTDRSENFLWICLGEELPKLFLKGIYDTGAPQTGVLKYD